MKCATLSTIGALILLLAGSSDLPAADDESVSALGAGLQTDWFTIDGGGGTSQGGVYEVSGTIGQHDASTEPMTGGVYSVTGGFWVAPASSSPGVHTTAWRSVRTHGVSGLLAIALDPGDANPVVSEPRIGGIQTIEVDFDDSVASIAGTIEAQNLTDGGSIDADGAVLINGGQTLQITFNEGRLPDQKCYRIDLSANIPGLTGDVDCRIVALEGDVDGNGNVTLADAQLSFDQNGTTPSLDGTVRQDVDVNDNITLGDAQLAFDRNGHTAGCP